MITAPFNFVPLSEKVFFPDWAEDVSHDIPFEDGESGEINITITAKSPMFIRNHSSDKSHPSTEFCNYKGEYFIPGSSMKGMVRNVLEIMSFSKMNQLDDTTYAVRDLKYPTYMNKIKADIQCGWLYKEGNDYKIEDCGEPFRIKYDEIGRKFNINYKENFLIKQAGLASMNYYKLYKKLDKKIISNEIKDEYREIEDADNSLQREYETKLKNKFATGSFDERNSPYKNAFEKYSLIPENIHTTVYNFSAHYTDGPGRKIVQFEENGSNRGKLVLTGHPSSRVENKDNSDPYKIKGTGKIFDFVFVEKENPASLIVSKEVLDNFKFAYFDERTTQPKESDDWTFWKEKLENGGRVPVFFHKNYQGIASFGLSYLYKFPYENSIHNALIGEHVSNEIDIAESIFGYSHKIDGKQNSLKGRVQFSHAKKKVNTSINTLKSRYVLLGTPKASYYPIYIVQNGNGYKTLMDGNAVLAGWKRYPIHENFTHTCNGKSTQTSEITPLKEGAQFTLRIRVHNLNPEELGALFSALTFHNNDACYHSIGMAKPYGYGKVSLAIDSIKGFRYDCVSYMKSFEASINAEVFDNEIKWHESEQIKNLFSMATPQNDNNLSYMRLPDFANEKNDDNYLDRYITLFGVNTLSANNLSTIEDMKMYNEKVKHLKAKNEEIKALKLKIEAEKKAQEKIDNEFNTKLQEAKTTENVQIIRNFIANYPDYKDLQTIVDRLKGMEDTLSKNKHEEVDSKAKANYELVLSKKSNKKQYDKELGKFIKKWSAKKNHNNSPYVAELVKKLTK